MVNIDKDIYYKAVQSLMTQLNFSPLREPGRKNSIEEEYRFITNSSQSCACILELTDGDNLSFGSAEELADLILNGTDFEKIDPLNFYINVHWFSEANDNSSEFNELFKRKYTEAASEFKNISFILINTSSKTVCSAGLIAPYHVVCEVLKECLRDSGEQETAIAEETVKRLSDCEKSTVLFDEYDNYNSFTHSLTFFYLFYVLLLVVTSLWAGAEIKVLWGKSFDNSFLPYFHDSSLLAIAANLTALLTVTQLAEFNYTIRKHILITFLGGLIGGIPLYVFYGCFYNWILPSCGALLYISFRTKSRFPGHKHVIYCLYAYLILTVVLTYLRDGAYGFTSFGGIAAGFFMSGIMHFEGEIVDKCIEKYMLVGLGITVFILILLRIWLKSIM